MKRLPTLRLVSIQWAILGRQFAVAVGTVTILIASLLIISFLITHYSPWQEEIENILHISFYSTPYFILLGIILMAGLIIAFILSFFSGLAFGRTLKKKLLSIVEGAESFSRGRLDHRIDIEGFDEIAKVGKQFNEMADRFEKQVKSLQRLTSENARLVKQTKQATAVDERRKIARELHDAVSQQLFAISMTMAAIPRLMDTNPEEAKKHFQQAEAMVANAQQELRALIMHLRPVTLEGYSLREGINQLLEELRDKHPQVKWEWILDQEIELNQGVENHLFRVIQEAVSNMLRHSKATRFRLKLTFQQERILLSMEDNGTGFDVNEKKKSSYGIHTMKERVEDIGGRFDLITYPEKGTRIEIRVPVQIGREKENGKENQSTDRG